MKYTIEQMSRVANSTTGKPSTMLLQAISMIENLQSRLKELNLLVEELEKENASLKQDAERYELLLEMEWFQSNAAFYLNLEDTETIGEFKAACDNRLSYIQSSQERGKLSVVNTVQTDMPQNR